ncbi:hypothetical protein A7985_22505 [Pseudoalteromonas luteoviolacea]|uniref:Uncharacterized protein n=1 Tax=Pseudoalteromonas luteoviolacea TaxID=43657 RepID=A0A1C0TKK3_9GAMM|nr:hypothetical protein [Pseudoalteromonas luteoviolacea]OCQ18958.1 hypothetical protein A7985_22505 [Pseudoalteromonas luteoviolacea]
MTENIESEFKDTSVVYEKEAQRSRIHYAVADSDSLLGTTSDTVHILLVEFAKLSKAIVAATSLEEVKAAAKPSADMFAPLLDKHLANQLTFPYQHKDITRVYDEISTRAQGVADIIKP